MKRFDMVYDIVRYVMRQKITSIYLHVGVSRIKENVKEMQTRKDWRKIFTMTIF